MAVSKRLRYEVLRRDNFACRYCGATAAEGPLTVDHVVPSTLGGSDEATNLVACCRDCNAGKTSTTPDAPLVADVEQDAMRWSRAMRLAAEAQLSARETRDERRQRFLDVWNDWVITPYAGKPYTAPLPSNWTTTVDRLYNAGLTVADLDDAVTTTMRAHGVKDEFRYFAGVSWRMVRERQEIASLMIDTEGSV